MPDNAPLGWPSNTGPLHSLKNLGLIKDSRGPQPWAPRQRVHVDKTGRIVYTATARFLEADVIRYLAALSFDNYAVDVYGSATPGQFEMRIRGNQ